MHDALDSTVATYLCSHEQWSCHFSRKSVLLLMDLHGQSVVLIGIQEYWIICSVVSGSCWTFTPSTCWWLCIMWCMCVCGVWTCLCICRIIDWMAQCTWAPPPNTHTHTTLFTLRTRTCSSACTVMFWIHQKCSFESLRRWTKLVKSEKFSCAKVLTRFFVWLLASFVTPCCYLLAFAESVITTSHVTCLRTCITLVNRLGCRVASCFEALLRW